MELVCQKNRLNIFLKDIIKQIRANMGWDQELYRSLCNIRDPRPIDKEYIKIENEYLQEELQKKEITKIEDIKKIQDVFSNTSLKHKNKICLWKGDITTLEIDAIF